MYNAARFSRGRFGRSRLSGWIQLAVISPPAGLTISQDGAGNIVVGGLDAHPDTDPITITVGGDEITTTEAALRAAPVPMRAASVVTVGGDMVVTAPPFAYADGTGEPEISIAIYRGGTLVLDQIANEMTYTPQPGDADTSVTAIVRALNGGNPGVYTSDPVVVVAAVAVSYTPMIFVDANSYIRFTSPFAADASQIIIATRVTLTDTSRGHAIHRTGGDVIRLEQYAATDMRSSLWPGGTLTYSGQAGLVVGDVIDWITTYDAATSTAQDAKWINGVLAGIYQRAASGSLALASQTLFEIGGTRSSRPAAMHLHRLALFADAHDDYAAVYAALVDSTDNSLRPPGALTGQYGTPLIDVYDLGDASYSHGSATPSAINGIT